MENVVLVEPTPMQPKQVPLPKQLFPKAQRPLPLASAKLSSAPRSPLGLVAEDINSPRVMVQAKQRHDVSKSLGGSRMKKRHFLHADKENIRI
jgi:hypothetical protein